MSSSQTQNVVLLAQHRRLRPLLIALDKEATEVLRTDPDLPGPDLQSLRDMVGSVHRELEEHFATEEWVFESALASAGGWGATRLAEFRAAHARDRVRLAALRGGLDRLAPHALARLAAALAGEVLVQMVDEECDLAAAGALDDDAPLRAAV
jgi:Hemerythrin HHE cation binding domain